MDQTRRNQIRAAVAHNPAGADYYVRELLAAVESLERVVESLERARLRAEADLAEALAQLDVVRKVKP